MQALPGMRWLLSVDEIRGLPGVQVTPTGMHALLRVSPVVAGAARPRSIRAGGSLLPDAVTMVADAGRRTCALFVAGGVVRVSSSAELVVVGWADNWTGERVAPPSEYGGGGPYLGSLA
jgi:hypothetical protein